MTSPTLILPERSHAVASDLRATLGVDKVKDDYSTLTAYAVDASIYRIAPRAVVLVESEEDIAATVRYAVQRGIPLTPRAAGTNLTGSAIGSGIILDVSRLNRVLELNREERWARVQPGIVLAELNRHLGRHGLMFGPDPSSGDMCKLGGMLANNSSGPHTLRYGAVKDNVAALSVCLQSGEWLDARAYGFDDPTCSNLLKAHKPLRDLRSMLQDNARLIAQKRPTVSKNSCGYNLFGLADGLAGGRFDLPKLFVGSEGTLGLFSEAEQALLPFDEAGVREAIARVERENPIVETLLENCRAISESRAPSASRPPDTVMNMPMIRKRNGVGSVRPAPRMRSTSAIRITMTIGCFKKSDFGIVPNYTAQIA